MKIVSLFDGISCGQVALQRCGIDVEEYHAYEIDKYAISVTQKQFPNTIQHGSVVDADFSKHFGADILMGGSPCQDLSVYKYDRGEAKGLKGSKSRLFFDFVRAKEQIQPKYFLLENVFLDKGHEEDKKIISEYMGVEPILINSNLVCAADRKRLYWTNIPNIGQPKDKGINLKDIVLQSNEVPDKYWYDKPFEYHGDDKKVQCTLALKGHRQMKDVYNLNGKCNTLTCDGNGGNLMKKVYQDGRVRKLTPLEYERLQTLPDDYTNCLSDNRRYTSIGNGWTVDVIAHIFKNIKEI